MPEKEIPSSHGKASNPVASQASPPPFAIGFRVRLRRHLRAFPAALKTDILNKTTLGMGACAFFLGLLLPWSMSDVLKPLSAPSPSPTPAAIASAFTLNLLLLCVLLMAMPLGPGKPWAFSAAMLRVCLWILLAFTGLALPPQNAVSWPLAGTLMALTCAQAVAWAGVAALVGVVANRFPQAGRMALVVVFALFLSAILWSKPLLSGLKKLDYAAQIKDPQGRGTRWAETLTQAFLAVGPSTALAGIWSTQEHSFDLIMGPNTYRYWIGSWVIPYPQLWPARGDSGSPGGAAMGAWSPGLILKGFILGLVLLVFSEFLGVPHPNCPNRPVPAGAPKGWAGTTPRSG